MSERAVRSWEATPVSATTAGPAITLFLVIDRTVATETDRLVGRRRGEGCWTGGPGPTGPDVQGVDANYRLSHPVFPTSAAQCHFGSLSWGEVLLCRRTFLVQRLTAATDGRRLADGNGGSSTFNSASRCFFSNERRTIPQARSARRGSGLRSGEGGTCAFTTETDVWLLRVTGVISRRRLRPSLPVVNARKKANKVSDSWRKWTRARIYTDQRCQHEGWRPN